MEFGAKSGTRPWRKRNDSDKKMLFDNYNESDVLIATVNGTLKEWVIIQNALRQIKSTEIETTLFIVGGTESA